MKKLLILALFAAVTFCAAAQELTVATYNIRNANREIGRASWRERV